MDFDEGYRLATEHSNEGVVIVSGDKRLFINQRLIELAGYHTAQEFDKIPFLSTVHPDDREKVKEIIKKRQAGKPSPSLYEFRFLRPDGSIIYVEVSACLITYRGQPASLGYLRDISDRKQIEEKYQNILENIQDGYFELDLAGNYTFVNDAECRNIGYSREELIGMNNRQFQDEKTTQKMYQLFSKLYKTGEPVKALDVEVIRKNGMKGFNEISASLIRDAEGKPIGFRGISRDITERKRAEDALRESEEKYRSMIETIQDGYFEVDLSGKFTFVNDAQCRIVGTPREQLLGMSNMAYTSKEEAKRLYQLFSGIYKTGEPVKGFAFEYKKNDGTMAFNEISASLIRNSKGEPMGFRGIARDVTERKRAEEERKQSLERLRKALGATVQAISMTVEMKDPYTSGHQRRVSDLARSIATEMGLSTDRRDFIRTASSIHDIGKIAIPSEILTKPTKLTDLEFSLIKTHSQAGYDIMKDIEFPWSVADVVLQHHERIDGSGYPQGLKGDDILLEARILAIADVVEAIASHRPYRPAFGIDIALKEISDNKGTLYDADAVDICLKLFREKSYQLP